MDWTGEGGGRGEEGHHPPSNSPKLKERDGDDGDGDGDGAGEGRGGEGC